MVLAREKLTVVLLAKTELGTERSRPSCPRILVWYLPRRRVSRTAACRASRSGRTPLAASQTTRARCRDDASLTAVAECLAARSCAARAVWGGPSSSDGTRVARGGCGRTTRRNVRGTGGGGDGPSDGLDVALDAFAEVDLVADAERVGGANEDACGGGPTGKTGAVSNRRRRHGGRRRHRRRRGRCVMTGAVVAVRL